MPSVDETENEREDPLLNDPAHLAIRRFFHEELPKLSSGHVVELGSRARSGITRKELIPSQLKYTGFDIIEGPNVDIVGDAHNLSKYFRKRSVDVVFSMSVFEHLAMPWKAIVEMNKIMKLGGLTFHTSHQTWPVHEAPWDYWRFSDNSWQALFNKKTGFEIVDVKMGEPARITPEYMHPGVGTLNESFCFLASTVLCRKVARSKLKWNVNTSDITSGIYPH